MNTIVVTIGRNIGEKPMAAASWRQFRQSLLASCLIAGRVVQRPTTGEGACSQVGEWEGIEEDAATYVLLAEGDKTPELIRRVRSTREHWGQEAAGFIVVPGTNHLI